MLFAIRLDPVGMADVVDLREFLKVDAIRTGNGGECLSALYTMINPAGPGVPEGQTRAGEDHQTDQKETHEFQTMRAA